MTYRSFLRLIIYFGYLYARFETSASANTLRKPYFAYLLPQTSAHVPGVALNDRSSVHLIFTLKELTKELRGPRDRWLHISMTKKRNSITPLPLSHLLNYQPVSRNFFIPFCEFYVLFNLFYERYVLGNVSTIRA